MSSCVESAPRANERSQTIPTFETITKKLFSGPKLTAIARILLLNQDQESAALRKISCQF